MAAATDQVEKVLKYKFWFLLNAETVSTVDVLPSVDVLPCPRLLVT